MCLEKKLHSSAKSLEEEHLRAMDTVALLCKLVQVCHFTTLRTGGVGLMITPDPIRIFRVIILDIAGFNECLTTCRSLRGALGDEDVTEFVKIEPGRWSIARCSRLEQALSYGVPMILLEWCNDAVTATACSGSRATAKQVQ